jgi:uncharacterized membrane protein YukC
MYMALFIRQDEEQSQLRAKITADLQERMKKTALREGDDVSKNSTALENQHQTKGIGIIIAIVLILLAAALLYLMRP